MSAVIKNIKKYRYLYLLLLPALIYYVIFYYGPMYGIQIAFKEYMYNKGIWASPFTGLKYFKMVVIEQEFWRAFKNTAIISFSRLLFCFPVPIILAILINELKEGKYRKFLQTTYTFPHFLSWVILSGIIFNIFGYNGSVNDFITLMGLEKINFLGEVGFFRPLLYATDIWKESGWGTIIYIASIATINPELYEAATVDGANRFQKIIHITLPELKPTIIILFILKIGNVMNEGFDQIFNMYNPVVYEVSDIIDTYIYRIAFQGDSNFSFTTAVGLFKSIINFVLLLTADRASKFIGERGLF